MGGDREKKVFRRAWPFDILMTRWEHGPIEKLGWVRLLSSVFYISKYKFVRSHGFMRRYFLLLYEIRFSIIIILLKPFWHILGVNSNKSTYNMWAERASSWIQNSTSDAKRLYHVHFRQSRFTSIKYNWCINIHAYPKPNLTKGNLQFSVSLRKLPYYKVYLVI